MRNKKIIIPLICLALTSFVTIILFMNYDTIVINKGLKTFRALRMIALLCETGIVCWLIFTFIRIMRIPAEYKIPDYPEKKALTEPDRDRLYNELAEMVKGKWHTLYDIRELLKQLDSMNEYQSELGRLLKQTKYLKDDPEKIVQRVEDCMYINIQKLLNYMRIIQAKSISMMQEKLNECVEKNADLLKKTDDFVVAVVGYINGDMAPGEEDKTKDYVDSYMFVVLQAIELPETYLK